MNALVIGYGSIGAKHARLLTELGCRTAVVSRREVDFSLSYFRLSDALEAEQPKYVVIANVTDQHRDTLLSLAQLGYTQTVLVEKPLFNGYKDLAPLPFRQVFVAYNLRFHPVIQQLKSLLQGERVLSVLAYAGQYLPDWRPTSDYSASYSASAVQGGGALRDLSHELDYLTWIFGKWQRVSALGGHFSDLEITSDDTFALMLSTSGCPVITLQLNYLDRPGRRFIIINTASCTIEADLINGTVTVNSDSQSFITEHDFSYREMHKAILSGNGEGLCSLNEGLQIMQLIDAAELAVESRGWVER